MGSLRSSLDNIHVPDDLPFAAGCDAYAETAYMRNEVRTYFPVVKVTCRCGKVDLVRLRGLQSHSTFIVQVVQ